MHKSISFADLSDESKRSVIESLKRDRIDGCRHDRLTFERAADVEGYGLYVCNDCGSRRVFARPQLGR